MDIARRRGIGRGCCDGTIKPVFSGRNSIKHNVTIIRFPFTIAMQHDADTTYPRCVSATMVFFPGFSAEEVVNHATSSVDAAVVYLFVVVAPFLFISEG